MSLKNKHFYNSALYILVVILIIIASSLSVLRIDLTQEKRYAFSETTEEYLNSMDQQIVLKVYLDGDMPIGLKRLSKDLDNKLQEFRRLAGSNFQYQYIDPSAIKDSKRKDKFYNEIIEKGVLPVNFQQNDSKGGYVTQVVFPGLIIRYGNKSIAVNLLKNNPNYSGDQNLNLSIENIEFELLNAIKTILTEQKPNVGFVYGQDEATDIELADIKQELSAQFNVENTNLNSLAIVKKYDCLVVADPKSAFVEEQKYILDQYLLSGGNIVWFVDVVNVNADSLSQHGQTVSVNRDLNLDDMFFGYGVRVNSLLIQDLTCLQIPVNIAPVGQNADFKPASWMYMPLATPANTPLTRGLNFIKTEYTSSIDFVNNSDNTTKTTLLTSSGYNRAKSVPDVISLYEINDKPTKLSMKNDLANIAVMVEGNFSSIYNNRIVKGFEQKFGNKTLLQSEKNGKLIVVADANIIKNDVINLATGARIMRLGYDRYSKQTFDNLLFVKNVVNYVSGGESVIALRSNEVKMRLLDKNKTSFKRFYWQIINVVLPLLVVVLFGVFVGLYRWFKYVKRGI